LTKNKIFYAKQVNTVTDKPRVWAVIPAAGLGSRFAAERPKQYVSIVGKTILEHSLAAILRSPAVCQVVVALHPDDDYFNSLSYANDTRVRRVDGGSERAESVALALDCLGQASEQDWVLVHDAARPCVSDADIQNLLDLGCRHAVGAILVAPVVDTIKSRQSDESSLVTVDRNHLWRALTPQLFRIGELRAALKFCSDNHLPVTDEASAMEQCGYYPLLVDSNPRNIKITYPDDLLIAAVFLAGENP
jgi:2-C-methyl-D-erythritol 4-phosphate cytidylyltransferase